MERPGVRQVPEGSGKQRKMEKTVCKIICGAPTTLAVKGLMMMMTSAKARQQSSRLAEPLWTDPGLKSGISVRELIWTSNKQTNKQTKKTKKKKKKTARGEWLIELSPQILASEERAATSTGLGLWLECRTVATSVYCHTISDHFCGTSDTPDYRYATITTDPSEKVCINLKKKASFIIQEAGRPWEGKQREHTRAPLHVLKTVVSWLVGALSTVNHKGLH